MLESIPAQKIHFSVLPGHHRYSDAVSDSYFVRVSGLPLGLLSQSQAFFWTDNLTKIEAKILQSEPVI